MSHQLPTAPAQFEPSHQFVQFQPMFLSHCYSMPLPPPLVPFPFTSPSSCASSLSASSNTVSSTTTVDADSTSSRSSGAATPITPHHQQQMAHQFDILARQNLQLPRSIVTTDNSRTIATCAALVDDNNKVSIELANKELWKKFHRVTNEMVVTRTGRKLFPKLELQLRGLDPKGIYSLSLFMRQMDNFRYKYQTGGWSPVGQDDASASQSNEVKHHDGKCVGEFWTSQEKLCFDRVKLTNREVLHGNSLVSLCSMHKYQPVVRLFRLIDGHAKQLLCTFEPHETQFIAVTAYQCEAITRLKVEHNPFAKGFREGSSRKRTLSPSPVSQSADPIDHSPPIGCPSAKRSLLCPPSLFVPPSAMPFPLPLYSSASPVWPHSLSAFFSSMANTSMSHPFAGVHQQQYSQMNEFGKICGEIWKKQQQQKNENSEGDKEGKKAVSDQEKSDRAE